MLKTGRIVDRGSPQELLDRYGQEDLEEVFLDIARNRGLRDGRPAGGRAAGKPAAGKTAEATA